MTARLTLPAPVAVLAVNGLLPEVEGGVWLPVPTECPECEWSYSFAGTWERSTDCGLCANSGRNPLLDLAGRPCPTCDSGYVYCESNIETADMLVRCSACGGSGDLTVEIWTDTTPLPKIAEQVTDWPKDARKLVLRYIRSEGDEWLGVRVGTATITQAHPIVDAHILDDPDWRSPDKFVSVLEDDELRLWLPLHYKVPPVDLLVFLPYADWTPGRTAIRITNLRPT